MTTARDVRPEGDGTKPPRLSRGLPFLGHLIELRRAPIDLFWRVRNECGEVGEINLAGTRVALLSGPEAQMAFFRAPDEQLNQALAYPFMQPIFGPGVIFDLPVEQRKKALRTRALRDEHMRRHADVISRETEMMCDRLGDSGEIDLLAFFGELTTYTSTATLIGQEFRDDLARKGSEFAHAFQDLERGTDAFAYVNHNLPLPSFRARDRARKKLVELITEILDRREEEGRRCRDLLQ
ncbi:MAG: cytochrome P450, partial [bacterium]|nr:cytochrome P450 [bacterium]